MDSILATLQRGLPVLAGQFAATLALLGIGMACCIALTPFNEWRLMQGATRPPVSWWPEPWWRSPCRWR